MITDLREILIEWSYRTHDGIPDVNNNAKLILLEGVLTEFGWSREAKAELLNNLLKEDDIVTKIGGAGGQYTVKSYNKEKHNLITKDASEDDIEKAKKGDDKKAEKERKKEEWLNQKKKENEQFGIKFDTGRAEVINGLVDDNGESIPEARKQKVKDYQNTTLNYLRSDIDDDTRTSGMKGKVITKETHDAHIKCAKYLERLWMGEKLEDGELEHLNKWVAVVEPAESSPNSWKMYIARQPGTDGNGNFNRLKGTPADKLGGKHGSGESSADKAMQKWMQEQGVRTVRTSTYAGKLTTANQIFSDKAKVKKIKQIPKENVKRNKNKEVESVELSKPDKDGKGGLTLTRVPKKENETNEERKKREQNNAQIDEYGTLIEKGELEFIDMDSGVNPDTPENRKQIIREGLLGLSNKLKKLGKRPITGVPEGDNNPPTPDPIAEKIIDRIEALSKKDPNENPKEWKEELDKAMVDLATHETLGRSFANVAEIYSAIKTMHGDGEGTEAGSAAFLPESTTLETVDVLVVNQSGEGKNKIVTIDGISVKKGAGGASQLTAKVRKSGFKKVGNLSSEQVKEKTIALSKKHEGIYDNDDVFNENPPDKKSVQKELKHQQKTQDDIKESAKKLGVDKKYIKYIEKKMNDGNPSQIDSALKGIMKARKQKGLPVDDDIKDMMRKRMESYYLYQAMSHRAYNQNLESQYFGNDSYSIKNGKIAVSESDGLESIAWPKFEFNLGFSVTGRSTNAGGGRFVNSDVGDPAYEKFFKED